MNNIEKIKAEIERRITDNIFGAKLELIDLLAFIDSLPEESKVDVTDFCKPIDPGIAQCIADNWWEMLGEEEKPSEDLEEAAENLFETIEIQEHENIFEDTFKKIFIAGAKWMKERMIKDAKEIITVQGSLTEPEFVKQRVIFLKED